MYGVLVIVHTVPHEETKEEESSGWWNWLFFDGNEVGEVGGVCFNAGGSSTVVVVFSPFKPSGNSL
ncbi:MAG: hypothetical protein LBS59_09320 [Puniceicoccales bacterium]|jgi:hypothetical protein|nr:hypothetical protein [Puniceicoccales bacterium]